MRGFVYILSNPSLEGFIKIGKSETDPMKRAAQLSNASNMPTPFRVEYFAFVENFDAAEKAVHQSLDFYRPNKNREFFRCSVGTAVIAVQLEAYEGRLYEESPAASKSSQSRNRGFICISDMPGTEPRLKIFQSKADPGGKVDETYSSKVPDFPGIPPPAGLEYYALVENFDEMEADVHLKLDAHRVSKNKNLFRCPVEVAINAVHQTAGIVYGKILFEEITAEKRRKLKEEQKRQEEENRKAREEKERKELERERYAVGRKVANYEEKFETYLKRIRYQEVILSSHNQFDILLLNYESATGQRADWYVSKWSFILFFILMAWIEDFHIIIINTPINEIVRLLLIFPITIFDLAPIFIRFFLYYLAIVLPLGFVIARCIDPIVNNRLKKYKDAVGITFAELYLRD